MHRFQTPLVSSNLGSCPAGTRADILEILVINVKSGKSKKSGNDYSIPEAQCILRNDDGSAAAVGVLVIPKALEDVAKPGIFTGSFALNPPVYR